jgi:DNA helicase-2/ATP-dependent DNA helicase PcrA
MAIAEGYDGEFGVVKVFEKEERDQLLGQTGFYGMPGFSKRKTPKKAAPKPAKDKPAGRSDGHGDTPRTDDSPTRDSGVASDDPLGSLNVEQRRAAERREGPVLVVAGPGTGKTRTLVARITHLIERGIVSPEEVLAISFTNQAAEELESRLEKSAGSSDERPFVTTFHGFGLWVLREYSGREVAVLDDEERRALAKAAMGSDAKKREVEALIDAVSLAKQSCDPAAHFPEDSPQRAAFMRYEALLAEQGKLDVDDLVLKAYEHIATCPDTARELRSRFKSVSVDEYQDINDVQAAFVKLITQDGAGLFAIGDKDQAIYGFRGARPEHFDAFESDFRGAARLGLSATYRLSRPVRDVAEAVLKPAVSLRTEKAGAKVEVVSCPTADSEAEQIVVRIEQLVGGTSHFSLDSGRGDAGEAWQIGFGDIAILSRMKRQQAPIVKALQRSGIPFRQVAEDEPHDPRSEKVAVMTMHASKGREFEVVFLTGVEPRLVPLEMPGLDTDPEEERRLLYVAVTRAVRLLVMSHAEKRVLFGTPLPGGPSPFIATLPGHAVSRRKAELPDKKPGSGQLSLF